MEMLKKSQKVKLDELQALFGFKVDIETLLKKKNPEQLVAISEQKKAMEVAD